MDVSSTCTGAGSGDGGNVTMLSTRASDGVGGSSSGTSSSGSQPTSDVTSVNNPPKVALVRLSTRRSQADDTTPAIYSFKQADVGGEPGCLNRRPSFTSFKPGIKSQMASSPSPDAPDTVLPALTATLAHNEPGDGHDEDTQLWFPTTPSRQTKAHETTHYKFDDDEVANISSPEKTQLAPEEELEVADDDVHKTIKKMWTEADVDQWFQCAVQGNSQPMINLLGVGFDVDEVNQEKQTALMILAKQGNAELVQLLLDHHANVNHQGNNGESALHLACRTGSVTVVAMLLEYGSDITRQLKNGGTALHCACQAMEPEIVNMLLAAGSDIHAKRSGHSTSGISPLHDATEVGDIETVSLLLQKGIPVDVEKGNMTSSLHTACRYGYVDIAKILLAHGACVTKAGSDSKGSDVLAIHVAAEYNHAAIIELLMEHGQEDIEASRVYVGQAGITSLHLATMRNHMLTVRKLLELGHKPNVKDSSGNTPLHLAGKGGFIEVAECLIKAQADMQAGANSQQSSDQTPLHLATRFKCHKMVRLLLEHGADVNASELMASHSSEDANPAGYTALHWATENNDLEMVKILLEHDADANMRASFDSHHAVTALHLASQDGYINIVRELVQVPNIDMSPKKRTCTRENITPLHQSVYNGHSATAMVLLENGADPNVQSDNGYAAVHYATQQGDLDVVRSLIQHGADVNIKTTGKHQTDVSPLHLAVQSGNTDIITILVEAGANINASKTMGDTSGVTPLLQAVYQQKVDIVKVLLQLGCDASLSMAGWYAPLHVAAERGCKEILVELLRQGALIDQRATHHDHRNVTPLHVAAQHGHTDIVRFLVSGGADLKASRKFLDRQGMTPLHQAAENGFVETVSVLCQLGSDINSQDSLGFTALHLSVQYNFMDVMDELITQNASLKPKTVSGLTAIKLAEDVGNTAAMEKLRAEKKRRSSEKHRPFSPRRLGGGNSFRFLLCGVNKS